MRLILSIAFFTSICQISFSTTEMCGNGPMSPTQSQMYSDILIDASLRGSYLFRTDTTVRKIPITFVMATSAEIDLGKLIADADSAYADMNISFEPYDTLIVDDTLYYHLDADEEGIKAGKALRSEYYRFNHLNVYIVDRVVGLQGTAPYCGFNEDYYGFSNWVILSNYNGGGIDDGDSGKNNFTFIHELGHHFCLLHTHHGADDNEDDCVFEGNEVEYVDGEECDKRGDLLCDTPADPNLNQGVLVNSSDCTYNSKCKNLETFDLNECFQTAGDVNQDGLINIQDIILEIEGADTDYIDYCSDDCDCLDAHGDSYVPDTRNYMSYTEEICGDHFTAGQTYVIITQYDNNERYRYKDCNGDFMGDNWSCAGCMEQTACNYSADATIEDFTCEFPEEGYNCYGTCIGDLDNDGICEGLSLGKKLMPTHFNINSIYPNPFNPTTTISYSIFHFGFATITAYDIAGSKLETINSEALSPGDYIISWDASKYPSGVYLIRIDIGQYYETQKIAFIK